MSVLENFKNIPRSRPMGRRQGSNVFFFFKFATKSLEKKKEGGLSPTPGATGQWARQGGRSPHLRATGGVLSPPHGRPGQAAYIRPPPHSLLSFDLKKSKKIQKKERGEKKGSGEALPNSALVIYR